LAYLIAPLSEKNAQIRGAFAVDTQAELGLAPDKAGVDVGGARDLPHALD
jgi:hypothetical protein